MAPVTLRFPQEATPADAVLENRAQALRSPSGLAQPRHTPLPNRASSNGKFNAPCAFLAAFPAIALARALKTKNEHRLVALQITGDYARPVESYRPLFYDPEVRDA